MQVQAEKLLEAVQNENALEVVQLIQEIMRAGAFGALVSLYDEPSFGLVNRYINQKNVKSTLQGNLHCIYCT